MNLLKPYLGRLIFTVLGLVVAILFLTLGFSKTIVILICCCIGYAVGAFKDKNLRIPEQWFFWRGRW